MWQCLQNTWEGYLQHILQEKEACSEGLAPRMVTALLKYQSLEEHSLGGLQMPVIPAIGELISPSGLHGHLCTHMYIHTIVLKCSPASFKGRLGLL